MFAQLLSVVGTTSFDDLPDTVCEHVRLVGFTEVRIYVGDVERRGLHLIPGTRTAPSVERSIKIQDTEAGRAYQYGEIRPIS